MKGVLLSTEMRQFKTFWLWRCLVATSGRRARLGFIRNVLTVMPSGQQFSADEKKPAMGRAGWESQKELDLPYAHGCENIVRG